ncbi:ABC transporter substrate-binding protein [Ilumatobacter coccineus]|uniref:ABC transporter substrate-binding protein n=1 Tax=Ilumatobacter coccineus (strain NBRC 103263 / KCTC 29153 / YM16-304) TaxID=1313172 RepID=A0A6C7EDL4_ILUCY|nr:ABC transporter substrate-binding protein [Ilumatobacter coccineus]BAN04551.1 ABC transporter substrate-binding protein [Ilumatobacter coccineus YM16-304]
MRTSTAALLAALLPTSALLVTACGDDGGSSEAASDTRDVTLVLDWTPNTNHGGIYAADAAGFYDEVGIDLEIIQPGQTGALQAVATGNAEFGISVQESLVPAQTQGVPVVSVAAIVQHNTSSLLALAESGIDGPGDLAGHRYGGFGGQLETALISKLVECAGADPDDVDYVEVGNTDYRVGLETGAFDFVWIFDGWDKIRLEQAGVDVSTVSFIDHVDCIPDWYTPMIVTSTDRIDDDQALVADFMAATARGYQLAIDDPTAAADALLDAAPELDADLVRASAEFLAGQYALDAPRWGHQDADTWTTFVDFLVDSGLLDQQPDDVASLYTNEFLPE